MDLACAVVTEGKGTHMMPAMCCSFFLLELTVLNVLLYYIIHRLDKQNTVGLLREQRRAAGLALSKEATAQL